jgi:hypothetical protein
VKPATSSMRFSRGPVSSVFLPSFSLFNLSSLSLSSLPSASFPPPLPCTPSPNSSNVPQQPHSGLE